MPIYDLVINESTRNGEKTPINFHMSGDCAKTRVIHFGSGDILISTAVQIPGNKENVLMFEQSAIHPIGTDDPKHEGVAVVPPVKMYFEKPGSIDVVISQLQKLRKNWDDSMDVAKEAIGE